MPAQSPAERQEALRARRAIDGLAELRGLYLPVGMHEEFKRRTRRLLERHVERQQRPRRSAA